MFLERLVIGSSVESIIYSLLNDCYFIPTCTHPPLFFKNTPFKILGTNREDYIWSRSQTILALSGKLLNYENLKEIKIIENVVKISTDRKTYKYNFGLCEIFNTTKVNLENKIIKHIPSKFFVYDDFEISSLGGRRLSIGSKVSNDTLAKEIHFYTSDRVDGAQYVTDCVSESVLSKEQLYSSEYSDAIVRFCIIRHLNSIGIHGNFMNFYKNGDPKYRKPKVIHKKRIVIQKEQDVYEDSDIVKIVDFSMGEIFNVPRT